MLLLSAVGGSLDYDGLPPYFAYFLCPPRLCICKNFLVMWSFLHLDNDERVVFIELAAFRWEGVRIYPSSGYLFASCLFLSFLLYEKIYIFSLLFRWSNQTIQRLVSPLLGIRYEIHEATR